MLSPSSLGAADPGEGVPLRCRCRCPLPGHPRGTSPAPRGRSAPVGGIPGDAPVPQPPPRSDQEAEGVSTPWWEPGGPGGSGVARVGMPPGFGEPRLSLRSITGGCSPLAALPGQLRRGTQPAPSSSRSSVTSCLGPGRARLVPARSQCPVRALPGGTGVSDPLGSPPEDQSQAAKPTAASPVPPVGCTASARVPAAARALSTGYAGLPEPGDGNRPSPAPSSGAGAQSPARGPLPSLACPPPWPLPPAFPWRIGEGETESPGSQHRRSSALALPLVQARQDCGKGGLLPSPSLSPVSLQSTGLAPSTPAPTSGLSSPARGRRFCTHGCGRGELLEMLRIWRGVLFTATRLLLPQLCTTGPTPAPLCHPRYCGRTPAVSPAPFPPASLLAAPFTSQKHAAFLHLTAYFPLLSRPRPGSTAGHGLTPSLPAKPRTSPPSPRPWATAPGGGSVRNRRRRFPSSLALLFSFPWENRFWKHAVSK